MRIEEEKKVKGYTRNDVEMHSDHFLGRDSHVAVKVKVWRFTATESVVDKFGCSEKEAQKALGRAFELHQQSFWEYDVPSLTEHFFGKNVKWRTEGRQGGWLVVCNIGVPSEWDGVKLNRWALFAKRIKTTVAYLSSDEVVLDTIEANGWCRPDMRCNQCEALMINGLYCHEIGCPNWKKVKIDGEWVTPEPEEEEDFVYDNEEDE